MTVSAIASASAAAASSPAITTGAFGGDQFMQLLLAQLKNQNPLDPVQDKDFMAQITQVNSLMEMEKVSANMQALTLSSQMIQAAGMIGKNVTYHLPDGTSQSGAVTGVTFDDTKIMLTVDNRQVALSDITGVQLDGGVTLATNG